MKQKNFYIIAAMLLTRSTENLQAMHPTAARTSQSGAKPKAENRESVQSHEQRNQEITAGQKREAPKDVIQKKVATTLTAQQKTQAQKPLEVTKTVEKINTETNLITFEPIESSAPGSLDFASMNNPQNFPSVKKNQSSTPRTFLGRKVGKTKRFDDLAGNTTTEKTDTKDNVIHRETKTQSSTAIIDLAKKTGEITTISGEKITINSDGSYTMEFGKNKVTFDAPRDTQGMLRNTTSKITEIKTPQPGTTEIFFDNNNVITFQESTMRDGKLVVIDGNSGFTKSFLEDGTIYSSKEQKNTPTDKPKLIEQFNNGPEIRTTETQNGKKASEIKTSNGTTTIEQSNFILTIKKSEGTGLFGTGLGKSNATTTIIDFSNYIEPLRKAKTAEQQVKIMDDMTFKMTGDKDLLKSPEYLAFRDQHIKELPSPSAKLERAEMNGWFTYAYKRIFSQHYKLLQVQQAIKSQQAQELVFAKINKIEKSISINPQRQGFAPVTYQNGLFMFKKSVGDANPVFFNAATGAIMVGKPSFMKNTPGIPKSSAKQIIQNESNGNSSIITFAKDNKTPVSKAVLEPNGTVEFFIADKNGNFGPTQKPTSTMKQYDTSIKVMMEKTSAPLGFKPKTTESYLEISLSGNEPVITSKGFKDKEATTHTTSTPSQPQAPGSKINTADWTQEEKDYHWEKTGQEIA
ncbi:hypothetical protein KBC04_05580 [Candidatus Babeliales bacterium]|nr:hypothetical protein [Candidatus Babeliales bacterium]MBP9843833.1 hypothetical protein [Candidatus Babeliales bacterium]